MRSLLKPLIVFLGGGNMTRSLVSGLVSSAYEPSLITVIDHHADKLSKLSAEFKVKTSMNSDAALQVADVVILAVKPQSMQALATEIAPHLQKRQPLLLSIAAGLNIDILAKWFGATMPIIRAMPNTPSMVQAGAAGLFSNPLASTEQKRMAEQILMASGLAVWLNKESDIDIVTALSGSGPAYYFLIMEIMTRTAIEMGLDADTAKALAIQTALGSSVMAKESQSELGALREGVTSKQGTTAAALQFFKEHGIDDLFKGAMLAAKNRSDELGRILSTPRDQS
ncbi:MAG: pyrroline-5-carboxylate reductase [Gammaproteobacteria bacterium]|nr:pyrroline-5-carboxylate reductase [Gammaproteobacteria bacterium]